MNISLGKRYQTRSGQEVRIYAVDGHDSAGGLIHGAVREFMPSLSYVWFPHSWFSNGDACTMRASPTERGFDLVETKPRIKRTVWLNVYRDDSVDAYITEEGAKMMGRAYGIHALALAVRVDIDCEEGFGVKP